ncbi:RhuM family protein [Nonlabens sp.]|uniref:virulence RhuM family protein n=1 Tax=Nonlabens sp. TaxID=1888209 RepID=UPI00261D095B|nr:RhuM family protein [Nonlabens sp.]
MENKIDIFKSTDGIEIQVKLENNTIWLDAHLIAKLFGVQRPAIVKHVGNIYKSKELNEKSTCSKMEQVASDGKLRKMKLYNLDMIISVGYRVNSSRATQFRQWANQVLKDYLVKGYALNEKRLAQKEQEVKLLKDGIQILTRTVSAIEEKASNNTILETLQKA